MRLSQLPRVTVVSEALEGCENMSDMIENIEIRNWVCEECEIQCIVDTGLGEPHYCPMTGIRVQYKEV